MTLAIICDELSIFKDFLSWKSKAIAMVLGARGGMHCPSALANICKSKTENHNILTNYFILFLGHFTCKVHCNLAFNIVHLYINLQHICPEFSKLIIAYVNANLLHTSRNTNILNT